MSKFTGRMNRLFLKTHVFISYGDHCLVRDYYKALFDESVKPEDFEDRYKQFLALEEKYQESGKEESWVRLKAFINENPSIWYKYRYLMTIERCKKYPRGILINKKVGEGFVGFVSEARRYFKKKSKKDTDKN